MSPARITHTVGIDEVGRGPLAGPVAVCACAVRHGFDEALLSGVRDSKKLSPQRREEWFAKLSALRDAGALDFAYAAVTAADIDRDGIAPSIRRAVSECLRALEASCALRPGAARVVLDGSLKAPAEFVGQETIVRGDDTVPLISAASVIAKVLRDRHMTELDALYPAYGLARHKGYGTAAHRRAIREHGPSPVHRRTFLRGLAI